MYFFIGVLNIITMRIFEKPLLSIFRNIIGWFLCFLVLEIIVTKTGPISLVNTIRLIINVYLGGKKKFLH